MLIKMAALQMTRHLFGMLSPIKDGMQLPKVTESWRVAPKEPLYSIGLISFTNLALMTLNVPMERPHMNLPMQIE